MDREKANNLYDLLDDLFYDIEDDKTESLIINLQNFINEKFLTVSNIWSLQK